jgi:hypothetical protein
MSTVTWKPNAQAAAAIRSKSRADNLLVRVIGELTAKGVPVSLTWQRKRGKAHTLRYKHTAEQINRITPEVERIAEAYRIEYNGAEAMLTADVIDRQDDVVTWNSRFDEVQVPLRQNAYYSSVDLSAVDQSFQQTRCLGPTGSKIDFSNTKKNEYRDELLAGNLTYTSFRQVIEKVTITASDSVATDGMATAGKINTPDVPAGIPITKGAKYLKKKPQVQANDGTYTITETWVEGDWDADYYGSA